MKKYIAAVLFVLTFTVPAMAKTKINLDLLNQADFESFSRDFGMALSYIPMAPAEPLGDKLPGFDAGIEASYVKLDKSKLYYQKMNDITTAAGAGDLPNALLVPRAHVQIGLPIIPIDLGVSFSSVPDSDIKLVGYELKYAILEGGVAMPALAIRGAYTKLSGVDELDLETKSVDISISKGIAMFTPYAGVGQVWITSKPKNQLTSLTDLQKEEIKKAKGFAGVKISFLPFMNLVLEGDFSQISMYSARLNLSF